MFMEQNAAARDEALKAIMSNLEAVKGTYKSNIQSVVDDYQKLIDESEVNRYRTRTRVKEDQANRDQLNSGLGRQERLTIDTNYDNNVSNLKSAREKAIAEIMNLLAQAESEAYANRANVLNNYNNAALQYKMSTQ